MARLSGLILPSSVASVRDEVYFCAACSGERRERGEEPLGFTREEARKYEMHVVACAQKNEEALRELSAREQAPGIFGDVGWDTEFEQWVRDNADALKEGRLRM